MIVKYLDEIAEMSAAAYSALPRDIRKETLVNINGRWVSMKRFDEDDSDLSVAMTKTNKAKKNK